MKRNTGILAVGAACLALAACNGQAETPFKADARVGKPIAVDRDINLFTVKDDRFVCNVTVNSRRYTGAGIDCSLTELGKTARFAFESIAVDKDVDIKIVPQDGAVSFVAVNNRRYVGAGISTAKQLPN